MHGGHGPEPRAATFHSRPTMWPVNFVRGWLVVRRGPTDRKEKGLSEESLNISLSSIHIHYNHTLTRALRS